MTAPNAQSAASTPVAAPHASGAATSSPAGPGLASDGGGSGGPSPYDALRPEGDGAPRSIEAGPRAKGPLGWVLNDAGLKVLALLLAFLLWHVVRNRIETTDKATVDVVLIPPSSDIRVVGGNERGTLDLTLHGTRAEVERAKSEFAKHATISYRFPAAPDQDAGTIGPVAEPSHFEYLAEGAETVVQALSRSIEARWVRVEKRAVKFRKPKVSDFTNSAIRPGPLEFPDFPDQTVEIEAPVSMFRGPEPLTSIDPDPIDVLTWTGNEPEAWDPVTPVPFELGFERWRRAGPDRDTDLVKIRPEHIKGKLKLLQRPLETLENVIRPLIATPDLEKYKDYEIEIKSPTTYNASTKRLRVDVRGDPKEIAALKAAPSDWAFAIAVPLPPATGEPPVENRKTTVFLWTRPGLPSSSITVQSDATVTVTLTKK